MTLKVKFHLFYLLTKARYVFDFRSFDQSRSKNCRVIALGRKEETILLYLSSVDYTVQTFFLFKVQSLDNLLHVQIVDRLFRAWEH